MRRRLPMLMANLSWPAGVHHVPNSLPSLSSLVPRIEAAIAKGSNMDYSKLMTKIRILESVTIPPPKGAIPISLEEARMVLKYQFNTTIEAVVEECGQAILDVNAVL